ncbi:MAG: plastocyanin/azurin family copper-binding protein, partial [Dehalococcoidia bacterium]
GFGTNTIAFIDTASNTVVGQVAVASPHNIAIDPSGTRAIVASQPADAPALVIIDLAARAVSGTVPLDNVPRALNFTPDGARLFFTVAGDDAVRVLDAATLQVVDSVPVGASPHHPLVTPDGAYVLVVVQGPGELASIDAGGDTLLGTVKVGTNPHWIGLDPTGKTAYVTNEGSGDVSVVDIESMTVAATVSVGNGPRKIVVQQTPGGNMGAGATAMTRVALSQPSSPAMHASGSSDDASADAVQIAGFSFNPPDLTVAAGLTIQFTNNDSVAHTTTSMDGGWDSGPLQPGDSFSVTLSQPGTYTYGCTIHPFMHGSITVTG